MSNGNLHTNTKINIGIIGPSCLLNKVAEPLRAFPSFIPLFKEYARESEAPEIAKGLVGEADLLMFLSPYPYKLTKRSLGLTIPSHYIPITGAGLYRALYRFKDKGVLQTISVDSLSRKTVEKVFNELEEPLGSVAIYPGTDYDDLDEIIAFHFAQYEQFNGSAILTGIQSISEVLSRYGIPNEWIAPTEQDMTLALERALLSTEARRSKESQVVLGIISVDEPIAVHERNRPELELQQMRLDIHRMLLHYVESLDGHLTPLGDREYSFVTTRGTFERETSGYKRITLASAANRSFSLSFSMGIGFGITAYEAGVHARQALRQSREAGGNCCFIVREDCSVFGPLEMSEPLEYSLSLMDIELINKAKRTGMTIAYLSKLAAHVAKTGQSDYTAQELAEILGVTVRSAHRFMLQWMESGMVELIGLQKGRNKGRPKQIFRLLFLESLANSNVLPTSGSDGTT